jgi:cytoskeletal protein CcmA (bactofilin family)
MSWTRQKSDFNRDIQETRPAREPETTTTLREPRPAATRNANIGQSVKIKGTLIGKEDLTIDGKVEGKIQLEEHKLTIGENGVIQAEVQAKNIAIHGRLDGDVSADDKVEISATGSVRGDIRAPRVAILDGATFKGGIDMEVGAKGRSEKAEQKPDSSTSTPTTESTPKATVSK